MPHGISDKSVDTSGDAERVQIALVRAAPIGRRLRLAFNLSATVIGMARAALARAEPGLRARDVALRFMDVHYEPKLAEDLRAELNRRDRTSRRAE